MQPVDGPNHVAAVCRAKAVSGRDMYKRDMYNMRRFRWLILPTKRAVACEDGPADANVQSLVGYSLLVRPVTDLFGRNAEHLGPAKLGQVMRVRGKRAARR